jgi:hypothetical protein
MTNLEGAPVEPWASYTFGGYHDLGWVERYHGIDDLSGETGGRRIDPAET